MNNIGRNDPCYCGSGKKYKHCCATREQASHSDSPASARLAKIYQALQAALGYHQAGRFAEAEAIYRDVIALAQDNFDALHLLGVLLHQTGRHVEAVEWISQALALQPDFAEAHSNLGEAWRAMGSLDNAVACFERALALKPSYAQAHYNRGLSLHAQGRLDAAVASFQQALSINPDYPDVLLALTRLWQAQGELKKALLCCQRLLHCRPDDSNCWQLYADILALLSDDAVALVEPELLLPAFANDALDPQKLERIATAIVCRDALIQPWLYQDKATVDLVGRLRTALGRDELQSLLEMPLLLALLEQALITNYRLEKLLVAIRRALLAAALDMPPKENAALERFACSLAQQCFANEYIYLVASEEQALLDQFAAKTAASLESGLPPTILQLALLGCYQALYRYAFAGRIRPVNWQQTHGQALLERQLRQPLVEEEIKAAIPGLTGVVDAVSQAVRQQYEENPYPRWKRRGKLGTGLSLREALRRRLPYKQFPEQLPAAPQILVAGCGTGSDAFQVAQAFAHTGILAVDISKTSLAYAIRATKEFGVADIDFRHADILELGMLEKRFDLIVCSGVLHHMRNPMAGWRVLAGLLRPNGYMNIGLYSRRARREVSVLRQLVAEKGYPATREGISRFRNDVMEGNAGVDAGNIAISPDFYSTSACRDLIFHIQEHVYSPTEIQDCLDSLGLEFLGFEFSNPETRNRYLARFPDNPACDSLANWEVVEEENPEIFAGMYQFWVKKRD